ncbi:hypothetical protein SUGI_0367460 [Cryptomeria japonica]|nr:hypothetical protein SUGI_0367460 [Cryptomeria japonica]
MGVITDSEESSSKTMDSNMGATEPEIQKVASNNDSAPRESRIVAASLTVEQGPPALAQSATADAPTEEDRSPLNQSDCSPSKSRRKSIIEVAVALFAASLTLMLAMPGGMDERGRVILGNTISFNVFLLTDMLALVVSLAIAMILAFDPPRKVGWLMEIIMWVAAASFLSALMAAGFVLKIHAMKWIIVSFVGAAAMLVAVLIYRTNMAVLIYRTFFYRTQSNTPLAIQICQQQDGVDVV